MQHAKRSSETMLVKQLVDIDVAPLILELEQGDAVGETTVPSGAQPSHAHFCLVLPTDIVN